MKKMNILVASLGIVGMINAAEQGNQPNLPKSVSAPLPKQDSVNSTSQRAQTDQLLRSFSVQVGAQGAVMGNVPLAPASSVTSLTAVESAAQLHPAASQGYQGNDSESDVATQIISSGEQSGGEEDTESFGTPTSIGSITQFSPNDSAHVTDDLPSTAK